MRNRNEVYREMEEMLGMVPTFFKAIPENELDNEWQLFKSVQLEDGPLPQKYRELIGIGISAATRCRYCTLFHTEAAKLHGATEEEITQALQFAKSSAGWSAFINGLQLDYDQFKREVNQIVTHVRNMQGRPAQGKRPNSETRVT